MSNACLTMILTDSTPVASRARVALYFAASNLGAEVVAPPIASYFIDSNPWVPAVIGVCCNGLTIFVACCLPETLSKKQAEGISAGSTAEGAHTRTGEATKDGSFKSTVKHTLQVVQDIRSQRPLLLLSGVFMVSDFARKSMQFLVQYASVRYQLTLGRANFLLMWRATAAIILHMTILPATDKFLQARMHMSPRRKDLTLARISICLFTAGFLALALAPTVVVLIFGIGLYNLGGGFGIFMKSMVSTMVEPHRLGRIYSTLSIMDTAGSLLAGPILAQALSWSFRLGHSWSGLPYMFASFLCGAGAVVLFLIRPR